MTNLTEWESSHPDPAAEFQHLLNQKELAFSDLRAAVKDIVLFQEALSWEEVLDILTSADSGIREVETRITQFRKSHNLGASNGNRPAA